MANANIIAIFKDTGLLVTIDIRTISDNELVVNTDDMIEMSDGAYKYDFTPYDETLDYLFICKANSGDRVFATNDSVSDLTKTAADISRNLSNNRAVIENNANGDGRLVTIYDDDGATILHQHNVSKNSFIRTPV